MTDARSRIPHLEESLTVRAEQAIIEPPTGEVVMTLREVAVAFSGRTAVRDVTFDVAAGEVTALIGPSGSGKTTLLRALNRMHDTVRTASVIVMYWLYIDPNCMIAVTTISSSGRTSANSTRAWPSSPRPRWRGRRLAFAALMSAFGRWVCWGSSQAGTSSTRSIVIAPVGQRTAHRPQRMQRVSSLMIAPCSPGPGTLP